MGGVSVTGGQPKARSAGEDFAKDPRYFVSMSVLLTAFASDDLYATGMVEAYHRTLVERIGAGRAAERPSSMRTTASRGPCSRTR